MITRLASLLVVLCTLTLLVSAAPVVAASYYVAPSGSGSACSIGTPCGTIATGLGKLSAGDTLFLHGGIYNESFIVQSSNYASGTSYANAITVQNYPGETATLRGFIAFIGTSTQYWIIDGLVIDGINASGTQENVFQATGTHHIVIKNCEIKNAGGQGILSADAGLDLQYLTNNIHGNGRNVAVDLSRSHGMYLNSPAALVDGNDIWDNADYGLQVYHSGGSSRCDNCVIRNNRIHHNRGVDGAVNLNMASNLQFYNNVCYNNAGGCVNPIAYGSPSNIQIYHNTMVGNAGPCVEVDAGSGTVITNNLCYGNSSQFVNTGSGTTFAGNFCGSAGPGCATVGNPLFVNAGALDFRLQSGSPAINAGVTVSGVAGLATDFTGGTRPVGAPDPGAYEFGSTVPPVLPAPRAAVLLFAN